MKATNTIILATILFFSLGTGTACAKGKQTLPDSIVTEDNVYRFMFTDTPKAEAVMAALRERGSMAEWELDYTEGDLYYNTGRNYKALKLYSEALASRKVMGDDRLQMDLLHRMVSCYDMTHNETRKTEYVRRLLSKARQCGDEAMQAVALFNIGKSQYYQGSKARGYHNMELASRMMEGTKYEYKYDNLRYHYNTLLTYYERDHRGKDALRTLNALARVVTASTGKEKTDIAGLDKKEQKALYAHRAVVMNLLGRDKEARDSYLKFRSLGSIDSRDDYIVMPYLFDRHMYGEIFRISRMREKLLKADGDTVNYHMTTVRKNLGDAYYATHNYRLAAENYAMLSVLRDSIKNREQRSAALELAEMYESNEKDRTILEQQMWHRILLLAVGVVLVVVGVVVRYNRKLTKRNASLAKQIKEHVAYKEMAMRREGEYLARLQAMEGLHSKLTMRSNTDNDAAAPDRQDDSASSHEQESIGRLVYAIVNGQLYLQPGLTQKDVVGIVNVPLYLLGDMFTRRVGENFKSFINGLRIGHAVKMFDEHPEYTIEAIAKMSGFSSKQSFHRTFKRCLGITPAAFKTAVRS